MQSKRILSIFRFNTPYSNTHIFVSWLHPFKEHKMIVAGNRKMAVFDDLSRDKLLLYPHKIQWLRGEKLFFKAEQAVCEACGKLYMFTNNESFTPMQSVEV